MANSKISGLPTQSPGAISAFDLVGADLTNPAAPVTRKINASQMLAAYIAAGGPQSQNTLGITAAVGGYADVVLYTPASASNDMVLLGVEIAQATIVPQGFYYEVFAGVPSGTGVMLFSSSSAAGITPTAILTNSSYLPGTIYLPQGNGSFYIRVFNLGSATMTFSIQAWALEFVGNGVSLPVYEPPAPYTGPLLSTVHVGPFEQFAEPQYGLQALADGGTMLIDNGHYYLPFGFLNTSSANDLVHANYGGTTAHPANRFTGGITVQGASPYGVVFDGRGGLGAGHRLTQGKGFLYTQVPMLVKNINFISCGGADLNGDGEAGIYPEQFSSNGTITVSNCGFDNNENGIYSPIANPAGAPGGTNYGVNVNLVLQACDFSLRYQNGQSKDGFSHDIYVNCATVTITSCNFYGSLGNCVKSRSPSLTISNSFIQHNEARCIDYPNAGTLHVTGTTLIGSPTCTTNMLEYAGEAASTGWSNTVTNPIFSGCTLINTRYGELIWMASPSPRAFDFTGSTQSLYTYPTGTAPFLVINRDNGPLDNDSTAAINLSPGASTNVLTSAPVVPGSIAQPGYTPVWP